MEAGIGAVLTILVAPFAILKVYTQSKIIKNQRNHINELERKLGRNGSSKNT